jgi:ribosomal protein L7/L12
VGAVVGFALLGTDGDWLFAAGIAVFMLSVMTNPARWWHYVRTGVNPERPPATEFVEPGACTVELQSPGDRPIEAIKAIREVTETGFADSKVKVEAVPATIVEGLSAESAARVRNRLEGAGATAIVVAGTDR